MTDQAAPAESIADRIAGKFLDTPTEPEQEEAASPEAEETEQVEAQADETAEPEYVEVEVDGEIYQVPPKLKDRVIQQQDYTRKTQEIADQKRLYEAQAEASKMQAVEREFAQAAQPIISELQSIDANLKLYNQLDWKNMSEPEYRGHKIDLDNLKERHASLLNDLNAQRGQFQQRVEQTAAEARRKAEEYVSKSIPNWESAKKAVWEHAENEGYTKAELSSVADPRMVKTLWKAQQYDLIKSKAVPTPKAIPVIKPSSSKPMPNQVKSELSLKKQISSAKTSTQKAQHIQKILEGRF